MNPDIGTINHYTGKPIKYRLHDTDYNYGVFGRVITRDEWKGISFYDRSLFYPVQEEDHFEWDVTRSQEGKAYKIFYKLEDNEQLIRFLLDSNLEHWKDWSKFLVTLENGERLSFTEGPFSFKFIKRKSLEWIDI